MAERVVVNTGPLIALARMETIEIAGQLPYEFLCPSEVQAELEAGIAVGLPVVNPSWLHVQPLHVKIWIQSVGHVREDSMRYERSYVSF